MALYKGDVRIAGIGSFPDQIQYMSQDDYNNLSEEAKMNGTTYGIIGTAETEAYMDSLDKFINGGGTVTKIQNLTMITSSKSVSYPIPEGTHIIYISIGMAYNSSGGYSNSAGTAIFTKGLPTTQHTGSGDYTTDITVDFSGGTITIKASQGSGGRYLRDSKIVFC